MKFGAIAAAAISINCSGTYPYTPDAATIAAHREAQRVAYEQQDIELRARQAREAREAERRLDEERRAQARRDEAEQRERLTHQRIDTALAEEQRLSSEITSVQAAFSNALARTREEAIQEELKRRGFESLSYGLIPTLTQAVSRATPMAVIKKMAIELTDVDRRLKVSQVVGDVGLVQAGDLKLLVPGKHGAIYQGTLLTELGSRSYQVVDLMTYHSLVGFQQAFRLKAIESFDVEEIVWVKAVQSMRHQDKSYTLADFRDGVLQECIDVRSAGKSRRKGKAMLELVAVERSCQEAFQRPVLGSCRMGSVILYGYPGQTIAGGTVGACADAKGTWTPATEFSATDKESKHAEPTGVTPDG